MGQTCIICAYNTYCLDVVQDFTIHSNNVKQQHLVSTVNIEEKYFLLLGHPHIDYETLLSK